MQKDEKESKNPKKGSDFLSLGLNLIFPFKQKKSNISYTYIWTDTQKLEKEKISAKSNSNLLASWSDISDLPVEAQEFQWVDKTQNDYQKDANLSKLNKDFDIKAKDTVGKLTAEIFQNVMTKALVIQGVDQPTKSVLAFAVYIPADKNDSTKLKHFYTCFIQNHLLPFPKEVQLKQLVITQMTILALQATQQRKTQLEQVNKPSNMGGTLQPEEKLELPDRLEKAQSEMEELFVQLAYYIAYSLNPNQYNCTTGDEYESYKSFAQYYGYKHSEEKIIYPLVIAAKERLTSSAEGNRNPNDPIEKIFVGKHIHPIIKIFLEKMILICVQYDLSIENKEVQQKIQNCFQIIPKQAGRLLGLYYSDFKSGYLKATLPGTAIFLLNQFCEVLGLDPNNYLKDFGRDLGKAIDNKWNAINRQPYHELFLLARKRSESIINKNKVPKPIIQMIVERVCPDEIEKEEDQLSQISLNKN